MDEAPHKKRRTAAADQQCSICLDEVVESEKAQQLGCGHRNFHMNCIELWDMEKEEPNCPMCRTPFKARISRFQRIEHSVECIGCTDACILMKQRIAKTMLHTVQLESTCNRCADCSFVFGIVNDHGAECAGCALELCQAMLKAATDANL